MSDPQLNSDQKSKSFLARFWANGGVFSIIALCFFLLSFAYSIFLGPGIIFLVLSLIWSTKAQIARGSQSPRTDQDPSVSPD